MTDRPLVLKVTPEQRAARQPLVDAGNRILTLLYRVSDQATPDQVAEAMQIHQTMCRIWNEALAEPIELTAP
jgi:hypothetical protein